MQKELLNNAKILLISDMMEDYKTLESFGFKNIHFIRSMERADSYFMDILEELDSYFMIITGFQSIYNYRIIKNMTLPNDIKKLKGRKYFYEEPNNRMPFPWFLEVYVKVPDDKLEEEWNINNHSLSSIISGCLEKIGYEKTQVQSEESFEFKSSFIKEEISDKEIYEHIKSMIITFFDLRKNGYTVKINDLNIYESEKGIRIEYIIDGSVVSAITFPKEDLYEVSFIDIELINNKGKLVNNEVGIYPKGYESISVRRANDKELFALKIIENKLANYLDKLKEYKPYVLEHRLW